LVFSDRIGTPGTINTAVPTGDAILQTSHAVTGGLTLTSGGVGFIRFGANGGRINPTTTTVTFGLEHQDCTGSNRRTVAINLTGRANLQKVACT
jgi:hypothetical protein